MTPPTSAPYGTWKSPIAARLMTEGAVGLGGLKADGDCLYWLESRPLGRPDGRSSCAGPPTAP